MPQKGEMNQATAESFERILYTTSDPGASVHRCAFAVDPTHAVTYRHGHHSTLVKNEKLYLFNVVDQSLKFEAVVVALSDVHDVLVFQLINATFPFYPATHGALYRGKDYQQIGVSMHRQPTWKSGCVSDHMKGWFVGSSHGRNGDSGSAILDNSGRFLGMSVGKKAFCFEDNGSMPIAEVADQFTDTRIISSDSIFIIAGIVDDEFQPPKQKLPYLE